MMKLLSQLKKNISLKMYMIASSLLNLFLFLLLLGTPYSWNSNFFWLIINTIILLSSLCICSISLYNIGKKEEGKLYGIYAFLYFLLNPLPLFFYGKLFYFMITL